MSTVYRILNTVTGECYVGGTVNLKQRWKKHKCSLRAGSHCCVKMQASWDTYGESAFVIEVLITCDKDQLRMMEKAEIARLNSCEAGFNSTPLGAGPDYPTRKKISDKNRLSSNTVGIVSDSRSEEGRRRRSETMRRLNAEGKCGGRAPGVTEKAMKTRREKHGY